MRVEQEALKLPVKHVSSEQMVGPTFGKKSRFHSSYEKVCQEIKLLPAPLRDAGVVTYIQPHLIPHLIFRGGIGLVALARRTFPRASRAQGMSVK
jgi:hypothetical protein